MYETIARLFKKPQPVKPETRPSLEETFSKVDSQSIISPSFGRIRIAKGSDGQIYAADHPMVRTKSEVRLDKSTGEPRIQVATTVYFDTATRDIPLSRRVVTLDINERNRTTPLNPECIGEKVAFEILRNGMMASATKQLARNLSKFQPAIVQGRGYHDGWSHHEQITWQFVRDATDAKGVAVIAISPKMNLPKEYAAAPGFSNSVPLPITVYPEPESFSSSAMAYGKSASDRYTVRAPNGQCATFEFGQELLNQAWGSSFADTSSHYVKLLDRAPLLRHIAGVLDNARAAALSELEAKRAQSMRAARDPVDFVPVLAGRFEGEWSI